MHGRGDVHHLAIFCDGAASDGDAGFLEPGNDPLVGKHIIERFWGNHRLYVMADSFGGVRVGRDRDCELTNSRFKRASKSLSDLSGTTQASTANLFVSPQAKYRKSNGKIGISAR
ncbi:hypothetical protein BN77_p250038 [Rhizobium mesoamericanum STM3625]|uniref:Uncharacterized protein n=1 Tax=Rhizobium mesoamericanum STM3625 TaxID=1211777 RepID=K0Q5U4_9HYPH|nr:hypothetical protein BN77_p250038 [Rhizobium mesoamericanum STM3625]